MVHRFFSYNKLTKDDSHGYPDTNALESSHLPDREIGFGVAFGVGILTMIFAIVRVAALIALAGADTDVPFLALFASIESFVGM
jgi:hypothetical protein